MSQCSYVPYMKIISDQFIKLHIVWNRKPLSDFDILELVTCRDLSMTTYIGILNTTNANT